MILRRACPADAPAIAAIYSHYVQHTAITFATTAPTAEDYIARMTDLRYPFFAAEEEGRLTGFIYTAAFRQKEAYRWDAELTIYLAPGRKGRGVGSALMAACLEALTEQGYLNVYACITLPNPRSIGLHKRFEFTELGVFPHTGYKAGQWHDVVWLGKTLAALSDAPADPRPISATPKEAPCID